MFKKASMLVLTGVFALSALYVPLSAGKARAEIISDQQLSEQNRTVLVDLVGTMQDYVKVLQMLVIRKLEVQVDTLQSQVNLMHHLQ